MKQQFKKENHLSYSVDDISSFEEAGIDPGLIQNQFLERNERKKETIKELLDRYSKIFGLVRHNTIEFSDQKLKKL